MKTGRLGHVTLEFIIIAGNSSLLLSLLDMLATLYGLYFIFFSVLFFASFSVDIMSTAFDSEDDDLLIQATQEAERTQTESTPTDAVWDLHFSDISGDEDEEDNITSRFSFPISDEQIEKFSKKDQPKNTQRSISWAVNLFEQWRQLRNAQVMKTKFPGDMKVLPYRLLAMDREDINYALSRFIFEVKKLDGTDYPPSTVRQMVLLIQMYLNDHDKPYRLLSDIAFSKLQHCVDNLMKSRAEKGLGLKKKQAKVLSREQENSLWEQGFLGSHDPKTLIDTMLYLIGLNFALRSGEEHRNLTWGQLTLHEEDGSEWLLYTEKISKTNRRGLKDVGIERKQVKAFARTDNPDRCIVELFKRYQSLCPSDIDVDFPFYLQPLRKVKAGQWFSLVPIGRNTLAGVIGNMCKNAGFEGK